MTRIEDIFIRVRDTLNDPNKERWGDPLLFRLLTDAQNDIAVHAKLFTEYSIIYLSPGQSIYPLPVDAIELQAVLYKNAELPILSTAEVAKAKGLNWRGKLTETDVQAIVFDRMRVNELQVFPRPLEDGVTRVYGSTQADGLAMEFEDFELVGEPNGVVNEFYSEYIPADEVNSDDTRNGIVESMVEAEALIVIYSKRCAAVYDHNDELDLPTAFDNALKYYVAGMALRNDLDSQNRAAGSEEMQLYQRELQAISAVRSRRSTSGENIRTTYNGIG